MKILVAYAGKTSTKKCVDYIKMVSTNEVTLYDTKVGGNINVSDYDVIIMGGSIRIGVMDNTIRKFASDADLTGKKVGLFVVCGVFDNTEKYLRTNFINIVPDAEACFGGEFLMSKVKGLEKIIIKKAIKDSEKKKKPLPQIDYQIIKDFLMKLSEDGSIESTIDF